MFSNMVGIRLSPSLITSLWLDCQTGSNAAQRRYQRISLQSQSVITVSSRHNRPRLLKYDGPGRETAWGTATIQAYLR